MNKATRCAAHRRTSRMFSEERGKKMIWYDYDEYEEKWVVTLNGVRYTSCDTLSEAKIEVSTLRRSLRYGA